MPIVLLAADYIAGVLTVLLVLMLRARAKSEGSVFIPQRDTPKENPLLSRYKYVAIPGNTNTGVFVSAAKLCNLYGVNRAECLCLTSADMEQSNAAPRWREGQTTMLQEVAGYDLRGLIPLTPRGDGNYEIPTEVIR